MIIEDKARQDRASRAERADDVFEFLQYLIIREQAREEVDTYGFKISSFYGSI